MSSVNPDVNGMPCGIALQGRATDTPRGQDHQATAQHFMEQRGGTDPGHAPRPLIQELTTFFRRHWIHLVLGIPGVVAVTVVHELAHAVAVWAQGGTVTEFAWWPAGGHWGHVRYRFPEGAGASRTAVALAPYGLWINLWLLAGLLSLRRTQWSIAAAASIYIWLFVVPCGDIANALVPWLLSDTDTDFRQAFGPALPQYHAAGLGFGIVAILVGFLLQRGLYRVEALGVAPYGLLAGVAVLATVVLVVGTN